MILVSQSPRRREIMSIAGYQFTAIDSNTDENYPAELEISEIPEYLAEKKAESVHALYPDEILIAADTIVVLHGNIIGKPNDENEAIAMLSALSGNQHTVISGVCIIYKDKRIKFSDFSEVFFEKLSLKEIEYYVTNYKPLDKAGAYGVQDWIGMVAIKRIEGSYYNVMGLPIHKLYRALEKLNG